MSFEQNKTNKAIGSLCQGFDFVPLDPDSSFCDDSSSEPKPSPDIVVYPPGAERKSPCDWTSIDMFIEWRVDAECDGYRESFTYKERLDYDHRKTLKIRGQLFNFAGRIMDSQHRLFLFAVDIYGDHARLYRFDPSCVVVSEPILYREDSRPLDNFFLRYAAASPIERGLDPTILPTSIAEKNLFYARVREYLERAERYNLRSHPDVKKLASGVEVVKMQVNDLDGGVHWYLASRCGKQSSIRSPCGRLTKGFAATPISLETPTSLPRLEEPQNPQNPPYGQANLYWLKDSWRPSCSESELSIYHKIKARGVPNLPDIVCAGDILTGVSHQDTLNDTILSGHDDHSWARPTKSIRHMIHHRMVSRILIPITTIRDARELLLVGRDILNSEYPSSLTSNTT